MPSSSISMMTSAETNAPSVGLSSGAQNGECRSGRFMPLASVTGFTAPMCNRMAETPARPYCEKSSAVIFAGIERAKQLGGAGSGLVSLVRHCLEDEAATAIQPTFSEQPE